MSKKEKLIFAALDLDTKDQALDFVRRSKQYIPAYKIGPRLFLKYGPELIEEIKSRSARVFLDLKFHDIPSSTLSAVQSAFDIGADYVTVHASAGLPVLDSLFQLEKEAQKKRAFQILFVTVLSSVENSEEQQNTVLNLADQLYKAGLRGLVCSPYEAQKLRQKYPDMFLVTPGIRLEGESWGDQKRVMSPKEALQAGSSALVMGRSLLQAEDLEQLLQELSALLKSS